MDKSIICAQHLAQFYLCAVKPANLFHLVMETLTWRLLLVRFTKTCWCIFFSFYCVSNDAITLISCVYRQKCFNMMHRLIMTEEHLKAPTDDLG